MSGGAGSNPRHQARVRTRARSDDAGRPLTVVIVDDDSLFRTAVRAVLEADGFIVLAEARTVESAVQTCRRLRPDVALVDVVLGDGDGFDVCSRLLAGPAERPAVILTSSRPAAAYRTRLPASGARGFLPKEEINGETVRALARAEP